MNEEQDGRLTKDLVQRALVGERPMKKRSEAGPSITKAKTEAVAEDRTLGMPFPRVPDRETTSGKLRDELEKSRYEFPSAQRPAKTSALRVDLARTVTSTLVREDIDVVAKRLRSELAIGEKRSDHSALQQALDRAELNAHDAHRLYITAKLEHESWELENAVIFGAMRAEATRALQHEKEVEKRSKQITDGDVEAKIAVLYPDEWRDQQHHRRSVKLTVDSLGNLAEVWMSRCKSLGAMLQKLRG